MVSSLVGDDFMGSYTTASTALLSGFSPWSRRRRRSPDRFLAKQAGRPVVGGGRRRLDAVVGVSEDYMGVTVTKSERPLSPAALMAFTR